MKNINWFPGHMARGMKEILKTLTKVDIVIEVRDARISFYYLNFCLISILSCIFISFPFCQKKKNLIIYIIF